MSVYNELLGRIARAYRDAGNGFHPADAQKKIDDALAAFNPSFEILSSQIDKQRAGLYPGREAYDTATRNSLRVIDADLDVLKAAVDAAARADRVKIAQVIVDQSAAVRKAKVQQAADREMVQQIERLIQQARDDVRVAGEIPPPGPR